MSADTIWSQQLAWVSFASGFCFVSSLVVFFLFFCYSLEYFSSSLPRQFCHTMSKCANFVICKQCYHLCHVNICPLSKECLVCVSKRLALVYSAPWELFVTFPHFMHESKNQGLVTADGKTWHLLLLHLQMLCAS